MFPFAQPHLFVNYPNGSAPPENFHFIDAPMRQSTYMQLSILLFSMHSWLHG
uniref:Uncharacterized protein n=1 Tax=Arundo donax TaxID=35708 RepID=A0A0A9EIA6_ARUDO